VPQPFVGFLLQSLPLTGIAKPLSRPACSPGVIHQRSRRTHRALSPTVSPTPTPKRSCLVPPRTMGSLSSNAEASASRSPWAPASGIVDSRQLHPLRSLDPPASPFAIDPSCPEPTGRSSLGLSPLKSSPPTPGSLSPAYASRRKQRPTPEGDELRFEGLAPLGRGGPPPGRSLAPIPSAA